MRKIVVLILLAVVAAGLGSSLARIPFGVPKTKVGGYYLREGVKETGAVNIVTSVVLNYRGFDTLGEVTILFTAAAGLGAVLGARQTGKGKDGRERSSLILNIGCRLLFPFILLVGAYIFIHGHLTPGGGFQGGAVAASAFLLVYLGCREKRIGPKGAKTVVSLAGLIFLGAGLLGLAFGGYFLFNFLPKGVPGGLLSAGIIPVIYIAIGFKVGAELAEIIDTLIMETQ
jgi:multicomponent Na+:H+ antiporter subunit B